MREKIILSFSGITSDSLYFEMIEEIFKRNMLGIIIYYGHEQDNFYLDLILKGYNVKVICHQNHLSKLIITLKTLKSSKSNFILCNGQEASIYGIIAAKILGLNNRVYVRHWNRAHWNCRKWKNVRALFLNTLMNLMSTQVIAVSELVRDTLRRELTKSSKIEIIRNGIELEQLIDLRNNRFKKGDPLVIGYLGRIDKSKGIKYLIQAYAEILKRDASVKLMVAGAQGNFYDQLVKSVEQFPDENIVIYPYRINKMEFFDAIDILVHLPVSPEAESFGLVYLEGIAAGLKCIFTQSGILERLKLEESQNQVKIVPFMDSGATVEALTEIIEEIKSNQFVQLSEEFLQDFSKQSMFNSYLNFVKNKLE